jgi:hypothetical protein
MRFNTLADLRTYAKAKGIDVKARGGKAKVRKAAKADGYLGCYLDMLLDLI